MKDKALVFVHGLGLGPWLFQEHFEKYYSAAGYDVFIPQLPGHSLAVPRRERENISIQECAEYLRDYLVDNVVGPYVLLGMSMGATICQRLITDYSAFTKPRGVVLMSSPPLNNGSLYSLKMLRRLALVQPQALVDFFAGRNNKRLVYSKDSLTQLPVSLINEYSKRIINGFSKLEFEVFFNHDMTAVDISGVPIRVIVGEEDHLFPVEVAESVARFLRAELIVIPGLGHMIPVEYHHDRAEKEIDGFLQEVFA